MTLAVPSLKMNIVCYRVSVGRFIGSPPASAVRKTSQWLPEEAPTTIARLAGSEAGAAIPRSAEPAAWTSAMCVTWAEMPKIAALIRHIEDLHARHGRSYILRAGISSLFRYIEGVHGERPWGTVLDAGTGVKSLQWIQTLPTERWTAVTAARSLADKTRAALGSAMRPQDRLLVGNWVDDSLLAGETFDTILVDYLVRAIEGFAPVLAGPRVRAVAPASRRSWSSLPSRLGALRAIRAGNRKWQNHLGNRSRARRLPVACRRTTVPRVPAGLDAGATGPCGLSHS